MKVNFKHIIFLFLALMLNQFVNAQKLSFKHLGAKQGLSSFEITDIIQDKKGFIWITTLNGVIKYDGQTIQHIKKRDGLSSNFTNELFIDSKNRLWISTWGQGVNYIKNDTIHSFKIDSLFKWRGGSHFTEDKDGNIWILGLDDIIFFNGKSFIEYDSTHQISNIHDVVYIDDTLWIATISNGVYAYDIKTKKYVNYNTDKGLKNNICYTLYVDSKQQLWAGCYGGLSLIKKDTIISFSLNNDDNKNRVKKIIEDKNGYLWLALYGNGMAKWDKNNQHLIKIYSKKNGLDHPYSNSVFIDKDENFWIATDGNGVYLLNDFSVQKYDMDFGFSTNKINAIYPKTDHLQILTVDGGEILMYKDTIIINKITFHNNEIVALNSSVEVNDTIWYTTSSGLRFRSKYSNFYDVANNISPVSDNSLASIVIDKKPYFGGIESIYTVKGKKIITFPATNNNSHISPIGLTKDKNNNLWSIGLNTIGCFNLSTGAYYLFTPSIKDKHFYGDCKGYKDDVYFVGEDYFEKVSFNGKDTLFERFDVLKHTGIDMALAIDIFNDTVYIAHNKGLTFFNINDIDKKDLNYTLLNVENGLPQEGVSSFCRDKNGVLWLGSYDGLYKYDYKLKNNYLHPPTIYLKAVELFSDKISLHKIKHLDYNQNHITFKWSTIAFNNVKDIEFSYLLSGFDNNWSRPTSDLKTTYKKLPHGSYQFKIKSRYKHQPWSDEIVLASLFIDAPFYKKWWFIIIVSLVIIAIIANLVYSVFITKKQKIILQEFSKELIQSQEQERSKISKDLHDSVGQLLLFVRNKLKASSKTESDLVNELDLALDEVRSISRQLHPYQLEKFGLTKAIELLVDKAGEHSDIFFTEKLDNIDNVLHKEYELSIYRIIQETINNIIKHSEAKSAKIEIEKQNNQIKIEVKDNGKGFNAKDILAGKQHSFGITGIVERVKIIKGGITILSNEKGTTIKIYIPI